MVDFTEVFSGSLELHGQLVELLKTGGDLTLLAATVITVLSGIVYLSKYWKFFLDEDA